MVAPNTTKEGTTSRSINAFSAKRLGIKKANTVVFAAVAAAAVVMAIALVLLNFMWSLRGFNNRVIEARQEALTGLESNIANLEPLKRNFFALDQDKINSQIVLDALPSTYDFPALATSVDKQVRADGLTLRSFTGDDESATAAASEVDPLAVEMPFVLTVEGSYNDLVTLIKNFEKTIRPMVIDSIELSGTDSALRAEIRMHTFYQPAVDLNVETRTIQ